MTRKKTCPIFICKKTGQAQILLVLGVLIQKNKRGLVLYRRVNRISAIRSRIVCLVFQHCILIVCCIAGRQVDRFAQALAVSQAGYGNFRCTPTITTGCADVVPARVAVYLPNECVVLRVVNVDAHASSSGKTIVEY